MQTTLTDEELLQGILKHDDDTLRHLYHTVYGKIEAFVKTNRGSADEAKDIFQEGVIALYQNIEAGRFQLSPSTRLTSYLFQICKFQWYTVLRTAHKKRVVDFVDHQNPGIYDKSFEDDQSSWEENRYLRLAIDKLGDRCKQLLIAFYYEEKTMKEIAVSLGQQVNSVKNAKYRCMQSLKELIKVRPA